MTSRYVVVGAIIAAFLFLAVIAIAAYVVTERCSKSRNSNNPGAPPGSSPPPVVACCSLSSFDCCDRGEYECDEPPRPSEKAQNGGSNASHVAAWELPSLDYLSEEQTMKYLRTHHSSPHQEQQQEFTTTAETGMAFSNNFSFS